MNFKHHILIVDDDQRIRQLLRKFFEREGFLIAEAEDADEAYDIMQKIEFDLLIIDVMMPKVTGIDFAKKIKADNKKVPIVLLTALNSPETKEEGIKVSDAYFNKPFDAQSLLNSVKNLLDYEKSNTSFD